MTDREPTDLDELLRIATDKASYSPDGELIGDLVIVIDRLRQKPLGPTLDDIWEQNQAILSQATFNGDILKAVAEEYHRALEEEQAELAEVVPIIAKPETGVTAIVYHGDSTATEIEDADSVHVVLANGTIPFAYEDDGGGRRVPGYYDNEGDFHRFDDRNASRRGW